MAKKAAPKGKVEKVIKEYKKGELNIGKSKKKVSNPKQAVAIAYSEKREAQKAAGKKPSPKKK
jgi:exonuclease VII small subunit